MATLSERLKSLRKEKHLTQVQVAEILNQTPRAYQYCEAGTSIPEFARLVTLADLYDVSMDYLIGRSETRERQP